MRMMEKNQESILLIIPYFGRLNNYFPFFLNSCRNNPTINWLLLTDDTRTFDYPENVKVVYTSLKEIKDRAQKLFDFPISMETPYKLCDYKPAYGEIFADEISKYDFWGYCDSDLIFGNIRSFLTSEILSAHNKILSRGHLSLYRNCDKMNHFYRNNTAGFYKTVYSNSRGYSFDEWGKYGIANYLKKQLPKEEFWDGLPFDDLDVLRSDFFPIQKRGADYHNIMYRYSDGKLERMFIKKSKPNSVASEEVIYTHFQKRPLKVLAHNSNNFLIIPNKIIETITITPPYY